MKKISFVLALSLILSVPTTAYAAIPEDISPFVFRVYPQISFEGETATCTATVFGNKSDDSISITLTLWQEDVCIATWRASGTGYMQFTRTKEVTEGLQYKLSADVTINGIAKPTVSTYGICP